MKISPAQIPNMVRTILSRLRGAGFEAYVVGGAVRDLVMGKRPSDWDIATSASPADVEDLFPHLTQFSLRHGTITVVHEGNCFEVSTFRGSFPTIEDDLAHRDFTINAMAWEPNGGRLIDPWGGRRDIERRVVRGVGTPEDRFREDPLRLLRAIRISCECGFKIHAHTRDAMSAMAPMLSKVAAERIRDELVRILTSERPSRGIREMARMDLLKEVDPELFEGLKGEKGLQSIVTHTMETMDRVPPDPVMRLSALFHDIAMPGGTKGRALESARTASRVMGRLRFSERMIHQVAHLVRHHRDDLGDASLWDERTVRRFVKGLGREHLESFFRLCHAALESQGKDTGVLTALEERAHAEVKRGFPCKVQDLRVDGRKVMEFCGIPGGPEVGRILKTLLEEVLDHPEWNTEEKLVARLKKMRPH